MPKLKNGLLPEPGKASVLPWYEIKVMTSRKSTMIQGKRTVAWLVISPNADWTTAE